MGCKTISVLGCGWLGLPLAQKLVQFGFVVKGSTTSPVKMEQLSNCGIEPFLLSFPENTPETALPAFLEADILVFNLPPSRSDSEAMPYEQVMQKVLDLAPAQLTNILFTSSTSVYPDLSREVFESDAIPSAASPSLLLRCEHLVQQARPGKTTVARLGGLMGGTRHPGRFLVGKTQVANPQAPVNMLHLSDAVNLLTEIILQKNWGHTFNACAPLHPSRQDFYTIAAQQIGLEPPVFKYEETQSFKVINSDLLQKELNYQFIFPDPMTCLSDPAF